MFHYKAFGLEISSEIALPGMITGTEPVEGSGNPDVVITTGKVDHSQVKGAEVEGTNYLVKGSDVYLWWDDIGKVQISEGKQVTVEPIADLEGSDELNLIPFLLGPVMSLMLHQRGFLVLHGSAVNMGSGAVAFLGFRGNGKSTTAIHLYVDGYPLVADDILAIKFDSKGLPVVYPGYPHVRLSDEAYNQVKEHTDILTPIRTLAEKVFCDASYGFSPEPVNLERIYVIEKVMQDEEQDSVETGAVDKPGDGDTEVLDNHNVGDIKAGDNPGDGDTKTKDNKCDYDIKAKHDDEVESNNRECNDHKTRITVLKSQENLLDLIRHSVANRIFQHTTQKENLIHCAHLVNNVTVKRLELVHSFDDITDMVLAVEEDTQNL